MNIIFSDQNCLARDNSNVKTGDTRPKGETIFGHTDVLIPYKFAFVNANTYSF